MRQLFTFLNNIEKRNQHPKKLNVGVIGLGQMGNLHLTVLAKNKFVSLQGIAEINPRLLSAKAKEFGIVNQYSDYHLLLRDPAIDVVDIVLPHHLHAECVKAALLAGKTVVCEKPLAIKLSDYDEIKRITAKMKSKVYIKHYLRYSCLHQLLKTFIKEQKIGRIYLVNCVYNTKAPEMNNPHAWHGNLKEAGGGILQDVGTHVIDLLVELFGKPKVVSALTKQISTKLTSKGEDLVIVQLEFSDQLTTNMICNAADHNLVPGWKKTFWGERGVITIEDKGKSSQSLTLYQDREIKFHQEEHDWWIKTNSNAINGIIGNIIVGSSSIVSPSVAKITQEVIEKAYMSARLAKRIPLKYA